MSDRPYEQQHTSSSAKDVAKEEVRGVGQDAKDSARSVGQTAGAEAQNVAAEARTQVSSLFHQLRDDVTGQAGTQQKRAAEGLHGLAGELTQMADSADQGGMATGLAQQAAQRLDGVAGWLEGREPADLFDDVRRYARRNPGTFLAAAAIVGFVGGRLTRGLRDDAADQAGGSGYGAAAGYGSDGYGTAGYGTDGFGTAGDSSAGYGTAGDGTATYGTETYGGTTAQPTGSAGDGGPPAASSQGYLEADPITAGVGGPVPPTDALYDEDIQAINEGDRAYPTGERGETR